MVIKTVMIVSGRDYQDMAAWSAPTYTMLTDRPDNLSVLVPESEPHNFLLKRHADKYGFGLGTFTPTKAKHPKHVGPLKCGAWVDVISRLNHNEILFLVDADTVLFQPLAISKPLTEKILKGGIGMAKCGLDSFEDDPENPWYVTFDKRVPRLNSGVIVCSKSSIDMFKTFLELSQRPHVLCAGLNDQLVMNYALSMKYSNRLTILDRCYNALGLPNKWMAEPMIAHCAGGPNHNANNRWDWHREECIKRIEKYEKSKYHSS
jgi:hypothetical protein